MTVVPLIQMARFARIGKPRPNKMAASHAALYAAVGTFNTDRLPGIASEDDVMQTQQQLGTILLCAVDLVEKVCAEIDASVPGSQLNPPLIAAILRDMIKDEVLDRLDAIAELARIASEERDEPEHDRSRLNVVE